MRPSSSALPDASLSPDVELERAIRERRTIKTLGGPPLTGDELSDLFELARWAPNHRITEPWRFRVLGPTALHDLKAASGEGAAKLDRAPTLIVVSCVPSPLPLHAAEDVQATACATYGLLLAACDRGFGSYWRTPAVLRTSQGRAACSIPDGELVLGLIHLGRVVDGLPPAPARPAGMARVSYLP